jgi:hypothetical protein
VTLWAMHKNIGDNEAQLDWWPLRQQANIKLEIL